MRLLLERIAPLRRGQYSATVIIAGDTVDVHWIIRHPLHDGTHHLTDLAALRAALANSAEDGPGRV